MMFSDTSTNSGILQEIESIVFSSDYGTITNSTTNLQTFTRYSNQALDHIVTKILESDTRWQYDDTTYTDFPIALTTMVASQQDYSLAVTHLKVIGVSVLDNTGVWVKLSPLDPQDMGGQDRAEFMDTPGTPRFYDPLGNSIFLYPAPAAANTTLTNGLKVYFQRPPNYFATSDTTKVPGIPSLFHRLVALWAAYFYCQANNVPKLTDIADEVKKMETEMQKYYSKRDVGDRMRLTTGKVNSR